MSKVDAALQRARARRLPKIRAQAEAALQRHAVVRLEAWRAAQHAKPEPEPETFAQYSARMSRHPAIVADSDPWSDTFDRDYGDINWHAPWSENADRLADL